MHDKTHTLWHRILWNNHVVAPPHTICALIKWQLRCYIYTVYISCSSHILVAFLHQFRRNFLSIHKQTIILLHYNYIHCLWWFSILGGLGNLSPRSMIQQSGWARGHVQLPCLSLGGSTTFVFHRKTLSGAAPFVSHCLWFTSTGFVVGVFEQMKGNITPRTHMYAIPGLAAWPLGHCAALIEPTYLCLSVYVAFHLGRWMHITKLTN